MAISRDLLGQDTSERTMMNQSDADEAVKERQTLLRENLMLQKIKRGYLGLGLWQHDLDRSEAHHQPIHKKVRFQTMDDLALIEREQTRTEDAPLPTSRSRDAEAIAPENFDCGEKFPTLFRVVSVDYSFAWARRNDPRAELMVGPSGEYFFPHGPGEVFEVLGSCGGWWLVRRPVRDGCEGWVWKKDVARFEPDSTDYERVLGWLGMERI